MHVRACHVYGKLQLSPQWCAVVLARVAGYVCSCQAGLAGCRLYIYAVCFHQACLNLI